MAPSNAIRGAQRANNIVALLEYKPGPGIYSRLERAVQQLPENVRVQELPGLLKRYKDGIPGWELKAVDLDSVVAGRNVVPRDELLAAVRERSPVFTHKEVVLGGSPESVFKQAGPVPGLGGTFNPVHQSQASVIGHGVSHGYPKYKEYGQGGDNYSEVLLLQPGAKGDEFGSHWGGHPQVQGTNQAVAHLRYDTHGDALRINEVQSDLGIHNRKMREAQASLDSPDGDYRGMPKDGGPPDTLTFPLEDAWADILTKRAVLEAARQGHRAIEVASPRSIADKVGGNIDNYEHFYGKVVPGSLERLGRKMGGLVEDAGLPTDVTVNTPSAVRSAATDAAMSANAFMWRTRRKAPGMGRHDYMEDEYHEIVRKMTLMRKAGHSEEVMDRFLAENYQAAYQAGVRSLTEGNMQLGPARKQAGLAMGELIARAKAQSALEASMPPSSSQGKAGRRYIMSDEMRKRVINEGIPAAIAVGVGTGLATGGSEAEASPLQSASDAAARAAMPWQTQNSISRLKKQVEAAYIKAEQTQKPADFKKAENLDAKLEDKYEKWDSQLEGLDEGDGDVDLEPNDWEGDSLNYEEQLVDTYGRYAAGQIGSEAELADALRGIGPDTATANKIPDADIIAEAKDAFNKRQAHIGNLKDVPPQDRIRAMKAALRESGRLAAVAAPLAGQPQGQPSKNQQPGGFLGNQMNAQLGNPMLVQSPQAEGNMRIDEMLNPVEVTKNREGEGAGSMLPDFSMAISPDEWKAYYAEQDANGMDPEHQRFKQNVIDVMGQPIIRVGAARDLDMLASGDDYDRITPAQFVGEYLDVYAPKLPNEGRAQVLDEVVARLDGSSREQNPMVDGIVNDMMASLEASSPKGKWAKDDPMPQEQLDALRQQHGDWADSMLTPGSAENFQSLRGFELLRTTLDGQYAPVYADNMSNTAAFVGGFFSPGSRQDFADVTLQSGPLGRMTRANREYFDSRTREGEPAAYRNPDGSSRFAATSATNLTGMMRAGGDTSSMLGQISWPLYRSFSEMSRTPVGKAFGGEGISSLWDESGWSDINHMAKQENAFDREQQVIPAGMSLDEFRRQREAAKQDREKGEGWGATLYPNVQHFLAEGKPTEKTWGTPLFNDYGPKFLQNTVGNIPSLAVMGGAAATGGLAGLAGAAFKPAGSTVRTLVNAGMGLGKGAAKGVGAAVGSQVADLPFDTATDLGIGSGIAGLGNYRKYLTTPEENNALLPKVDPNSMSIEELDRERQKALDERDRQFQSNKFQWGQR